MKSSSKSLAVVSVMFVAFAGSCLLDFHDYVLVPDAGADDAGKGGGGGAAGSGGGGAGPSSASASSSTSSGISCPTCDDNNLCTKDICKDGKCTNTPLPVKDDGNACTLDTCDKDTGMSSHKLIPSCCAHSACSAGNGPLDPASCNPTGTQSCVALVCGAKPQCCNTRWDQDCVYQAMVSCVAEGGPPEVTFSCKCSHPYCQVGAALDPSCDPCVNEICKAKPMCCSSPGIWDQSCIAAATKYCGIPVGANCQ